MKLVVGLVHGQTRNLNLFHPPHSWILACRPGGEHQVSGRLHNHTATASIRSGAPNVSQREVEVTWSARALRIIMRVASPFALRGTAPRSRQFRITPLYAGCSSRRRSSAGHALLPAHAATIMNGTVGRTGTAIPRMPRPSAVKATIRQSRMRVPRSIGDSSAGPWTCALECDVSRSREADGFSAVRVEQFVRQKLFTLFHRRHAKRCDSFPYGGIGDAINRSETPRCFCRAKAPCSRI